MRWAVRATASGSSSRSITSSACTPAARDDSTSRPMSSRRGGGARSVPSAAAPARSTPSTSRRSSIASRAVTRISPAVSRTCSGPARGVDLERAGVHGDQRHLVGQHVVHLAGDPRPLAQRRLLGPQLLLLLGPRRPVAQRGDEVATGPDVRAGGRAEPGLEQAEDDGRGPALPGVAGLGDGERRRHDQRHHGQHPVPPADGQREQPDGHRHRHERHGEHGDPDQRHDDRVGAAPPQRRGADQADDARRAR